MWRPVLLALTYLLTLHLTSALDNGLGLTPPMGWLSWQQFRCQTNCKANPDNCISERLIKQVADRMVSEGFKAAGYEYVNIDDCWASKQRDKDGKLVGDPARFPSGMKALADYIHSKGLKFGIYGDFGSATCGGFPGSEYYLQTDADTFAEWGVDFLKFDGCNSAARDFPVGFPLMTKFLNMTGRPMIFNCEWPIYMEMGGLTPNLTAVRENCNLWRIHGDIKNSWSSITSIISYINANNSLVRSVVGPGGWNDPDMIIAGIPRNNLTPEQERAQMGMWCMFAAPLLMSNDPRNLTDEVKAILQNRNFIAINQDPLGDMATPMYSDKQNISVWTKQLVLPAKGSVAVAFLSLADNHTSKLSSTITFSLQKLGLSNANGYNVTEAFDNKPLGTFRLSQDFNVTVAASTVQIWLATPV